MGLTTTVTVTLPATNALKLWLKADVITGPNDGDLIGTWSDSSGNAGTAVTVFSFVVHVTIELDVDGSTISCRAALWRIFLGNAPEQMNG